MIPQPLGGAATPGEARSIDVHERQQRDVSTGLEEQAARFQRDQPAVRIADQADWPKGEAVAKLVDDPPARVGGSAR